MLERTQLHLAWCPSPAVSGWRARRALATLALAALLGCSSKSQETRRGPPPPEAPKSPASACGDARALADVEAAPLLPVRADAFCLDPNGGTKAFGEKAALPIDGICEVFDGECEIYKGFSVRRLVEARYVDGAGSPATIDVHLSKFASPEGAYGMFTKRVVGDGDPDNAATPKPIEASGRGALGLGNAYLWRGQYLVELTFNDESAAEDALRAKSDKLLPPLVAAISEKLPGDVAAPGVALLPRADRLPLGERYVVKDLLGVPSIGGGLFGYYKAGAKRFRVAVLPRSDEDQAKDVLSTFSKLAGATKEKNLGEGGGVRFMHADVEGAAVEWIFARSGKNVIGVGDEPRAEKPGATAEEHAKVSLSTEEKIERLKASLRP